ncbi:hypothetical protein [Pseudobacteroides cellulosolvens]|uniref:Uncharacterized protein n=1 Tax=Pseudobacteroides cellulosolvens ATCC 35603 = DSM 2933 TaxID=398512 RepID=A0A0L6JU71_9FIRM|nr:hypothetical protein [Pseudobacteroides cellulosolvens]KNY29406.1 hypothetical protein Bccel_4680 [Pseudobacteroides cellulosolvens ATCC 35603 = DSM 2933]
MITRIFSKRNFVVSLALTAVLSSFSFNSHALYESYPYNDGTQVKQYVSTAKINDIAATESSFMNITPAVSA